MEIRLNHSHLLIDALGILQGLKILHNINLNGAINILEKTIILIESKYEV
jgi:hypothetical protein